MCSICTCPFESGERVARLICRHVFHAYCLERMHVPWASRPARETQGFEIPPCVNCRGGGRVIATWPWIAAAPDPSPAAVAISTPPSPGRRYFTPATSHPTSRDASPAFMTLAMPWWPAESQHSSFHASTGLGPGRWGLLVDPGSWGNLVGGDFLRQAAAHAVQSGASRTAEAKLPNDSWRRGCRDTAVPLEWSAPDGVSSS